MAKKGHHGGSWKVAYADFVTAMMALFLVLWIAAQDAKIKEAVQRAFRNPFSSIAKESTGIVPNKETQAVKSEKGNFDSASAIELTMLRRLNQDLMEIIQESPEEEQSVKLELTPEGLRISIFDRAKKPIFEKESPQLTDYGSWVISTLAWEIARYTNFLIDIEGHTEKGHKPKNQFYGPWELSADRANAARRKLIDFGVGPSQIKKVVGFADTKPMTDRPPDDESNNRVAVLLRVSED